MIKGWKNNPLWVKHYAEVQEKIINERIELASLEIEMARLQREAFERAEKHKNCINGAQTAGWGTSPTYQKEKAENIHLSKKLREILKNNCGLG